MNANPRRQETPSLCLSFFLSDSNRPWSLFLISCRFFSSLHPCLWPPRFAFQASSSRHQPSRVRGCWRPSVCSRRSILWPPPSFTCRGAAALILAPPVFLRAGQYRPPLQVAWISKQLPAQAQPLLPLSFARRGCPDTPSNVLAEFKDLKKKNPKHFHLSPRRAHSRHSWRGTLKRGVYFPQTVFPFHDMNSLPSNHLAAQHPIHSSQSPGGNTHPSQETNHWFIRNAHGNSVQPKNSHFLLPSLFSITLVLYFD